MMHFETLKCNDILKFNVIDKKMKKKSTINFIVKLHNYIRYLQCTKLKYMCVYVLHIGIAYHQGMWWLDG